MDKIIYFVNNYLLLFVIMFIFFGLLIVAIDRYFEHKVNRKDEENKKDKFIALDNEWLLNNEKTLRDIQKDYLGIINIDILNLEKLRIDEKIEFNREKIKENKSLLDAILQIIFLLISFGLGFGALNSISDAISVVGNTQTVVGLEKFMLYIFYFMFLVITISLIVIIPYFLVSLIFRRILKNNDTKNKELNSENHNLKIRKIAINNCIKKLEKITDT